MHYGPQSPSGPGFLGLSAFLIGPATTAVDAAIIPFRAPLDIEFTALLFTTGAAALAAGETVSASLVLCPPTGDPADATNLGIFAFNDGNTPAVGVQRVTITAATIAGAVAPDSLTVGWELALVLTYGASGMNDTFDQIIVQSSMLGGGVQSPYDGR